MTKPNLFIVGAPKCGTTAWVSYLSSHADIFFSPMKEPHHFNHDLPGYRWVKDPEEYARLFADAGRARVIAEASVFYLYSEAAAVAIRRFNPAAKVIILLREQEDYLPSLHNQIVFNGDEGITDFERAWRLSGKRSDKTVGSFCRERKLLDYAALGRFSIQVERYLRAFPNDQVLILQFRDWTRDPRTAYLKILSFLGLHDDGRAEFPRINEAQRRRINWLTPLLRRPPRSAVKAAETLKKVMGMSSFGVVDAGLRLNSRSGYRTRISATLRAEIRSYYQRDNLLLEQYLSTAKQSAASKHFAKPDDHGEV